jgi:aspartate kinase
MALIVHKYGGTSMGSTERIRNVAKRVAKWARAGHQMVVVPSAMSGETNRLLGLAKELAPERATRLPQRELDMLAATGEQVSVGLLAIALQAEGMGPSATPAGRCPSAPTAPTPRRASNPSTTSACAPTWPPARW